jgi:hypothetical protein
MAYKILADVTLSNGSAIVAVNSAESLGDIATGDHLFLIGALPVQIISADTAARTITLSTAWAISSPASSIVAVLPTSADFRAATTEVKALSTLAEQSINQWDALVNTETTVTVTLPDNSTVQIDSLPRVLINATAAGTALYNDAQAAINSMGDAPALAQEVADDYALFAPNYAEWVANSPAFLTNYAAVNSNISTFTNTTLPTAQQTRIDATSAAQLAATDLVTAAQLAETNATTAKGLAENWADKATEVETGRYSAKYWADQAQVITDTESYVLNTRTINGQALSADVVITVADIATLQTSLDFNFALAAAGL